MGRSPALLLGLSAVWLIGAAAQAASTGREAATFLNIPVGAAPAALGGAYSALATDAYAPVWNPAGLGALATTQVSGQHLAYLEGMRHEFVSAVHPLRPGDGIGFSVQYLGTGDVVETDPSGRTLGSFSNHFAAYTLAYGHQFAPAWSAGIAGKGIEGSLADAHAGTYAFDAGFLHQPNDRVQWTARLANAGRRFTFINDGDPLPLAFRMGVAVKPAPSWRVSLEGAHRPLGGTTGHAGVEWSPVSMLALRMGYASGTERHNGGLTGLSTGIGLRFWEQELAYAWVPYGNLGDTHAISLVLRFGSPPNAAPNLKTTQAPPSDESLLGELQ